MMNAYKHMIKLLVFLVGILGAVSAKSQDINANWFTHFELETSDGAQAMDREFE
jgi:hypothetical protein